MSEKSDTFFNVCCGIGVLTLGFGTFALLASMARSINVDTNAEIDKSATFSLFDSPKEIRITTSRPIYLLNDTPRPRRPHDAR